jgi:hypothetical protein
MATANKMTGFIISASLGLSLTVGINLNAQASPIQNATNAVSNKVQKVTIIGKRFSVEQKRLFDLEQRNKLTIDQNEKSSVTPASEHLGKAEASIGQFKLIKSSAKTT